MPDEITVTVPLRRSEAICDICSQKQEVCFHSPNSANDLGTGRDICLTCIEKLHALVHASDPK
jgi:hypothetical protein